MGNYRGMSFVSYAGKVLLKVVAKRLRDYCENNGILPEEQCEFRPDRPTTDMFVVLRRLQEVGRKPRVSLFMRFIVIGSLSVHRSYTGGWCCGCSRGRCRLEMIT